MEIKELFIKNYNSFGIEAINLLVQTLNRLNTVLISKFILGGGSNMFNTLMLIHIDLKGKKNHKED
jgi:hypothetical protein